MIFSRGQSEYIAAVIAVVSMVLLGMLYINAIEGLHREADLSIKKIAALREELEIAYDRNSHTLSIEGNGRPLYIVYILDGELHIDRTNTTDSRIDLATLPKYRELVEDNKTIDRICIITYSQNMFCTKNSRPMSMANNSVTLTASISKCTVMLSRYLSDSDLFTLLESYYTYNCSATSYPISSIGFTAVFSFSGSDIIYTVTGADGSVWGSGSIPFFSSLPTNSYILLGSKSFVYSLGVADLVVDVYVYYSFPEVGTAVDTGGRSVAYVWPVPRIYIVQRLIHRGYLFAVSSRASCTSLPCYLLYALRDYVDYPWQSWSGDYGWWLRFSPTSVVDRTVGVYDNYIGRSTVYADYRVSATGINVTVNGANNLYCYSRIDQLHRDETALSIVLGSADLSSYGRWLPKDFFTPPSPTTPSVFATYVKRAMSVYNVSSASFYIYSYFYDGRLYQVYLDYTDPAAHRISIQLRYDSSRPLYLFVLDVIGK
ncbi:MAG: hypothetical protein QXG40_03825 [Ignisphaera sp.]